MEAITREEKLMSGQQLEPITRKELFLAKAAGMDVQTPEPITREEMFLSKISGSSGGGAAPVVEPLTVTENGTYTPPEGVDGYNPVTVNVAASTDQTDMQKEYRKIIERPSGANIIIPEPCYSVGAYVFSEYGSLYGIQFPDTVKTIGNNAFDGCYNLAIDKLPNSLTTIGNFAFRDCRKTKTLIIPASVTKIGNTAFSSNSELTEVTFEGTPTNVGTSLFSGCSNLLTINVPWAEGEVANAPWGATNATINYNYTGG